MQTPPKPADEATRLASLKALEILDTEPEERFDRLTRLARRLFGVPIALVSLVVENRQWFKSCQGLDASETSRDVSFCGHAILDDDILVIRDATLDERFHDNPLVTGDPNIRFYAGCPLRVRNGSKIGTLCLIDREPRDFGDEDMSLLRDLAHTTEQELTAVVLATIDDLTMLSNRRGFEILSAHAISLSRRIERPAALIYFDLDGFKPINDQYGHAEGDRTLADFADMLKRTFRESDVIGRLGGDEFAVLLTNVRLPELDNVVERLRQAVYEHNNEAKRGYDIAFSAGAVPFDPARHADVAALMAEADAEMYRHKKNKHSASSSSDPQARSNATI